jgi:apolipoprotein N-acyltransferase
MTVTYVLGNILGRAIISCLLVWLVCWLISRFDWRLTLKRGNRWYSWLAVVALTLLGLGAAATRGGL